MKKSIDTETAFLQISNAKGQTALFFRTKQASGRTYLQLVENQWKDGRTMQRVIANVGRLDKLQASGDLEGLIQSGTRFCKSSISYIATAPEETQLSSHQISRLAQVSPSTVVSWINQGLLPATRTPGGHRRVTVRDLRQFLTEHQMPMPAELALGTTARRVFIVDDDPLAISAIKRAILQHDPRLEVEGCTDGIEALVMIGALLPDLVLLDVHMEAIDGFEVCRRLRKMARLAEMKIVAITAFPSEEDRSRILNYGAADYWIKPVSAQRVAEILAAGEAGGLQTGAG